VSGESADLQQGVSMENPGANRGASWARNAVVFCMHQFIGTFGTTMVANVLMIPVFNLSLLFGWQIPLSYYQRLAGPPLFPAQLLLGLFLGWLLGRHLQQRSMLWIWVVPWVCMCFIFAAFRLGWLPNRDPWVIELVRRGATAPLCSAAGYSGGALLARMMPIHSSLAGQMHSRGVLTFGLVVVGAALLDLVQSLRQGWQGMMFAIEAAPAAVGLCLILIAIRYRPKPISSGA
jgi:hypothetical protein